MNRTTNHPPSTQASLLSALERAEARRAPLAETTTCYRLHDERADDLPGVTVERFAGHAVVWLSTESAVAQRDAIAAALIDLGMDGVYGKVREKTDLRRVALDQIAPAAPLRGREAPLEFEVFEHGRRFWVRLADGLSTGLFLDQRDNRSQLQLNCRGARILNLFCYTGSFSVAAGLGGAEQVTSIDSSKSALERCDRNLKLNELTPERHRLLRADATKWLERATRRPQRFDWIVLDPPTFSSTGAKSFSVEHHYQELVRHCATLLAPNGRLLAITNHRKTSRRNFERLVKLAVNVAGRSISTMQWPEPPIDCPHGHDTDAATKSVLIQAR